MRCLGQEAVSKTVWALTRKFNADIAVTLVRGCATGADKNNVENTVLEKPRVEEARTAEETTETTPAAVKDEDDAKVTVWPRPPTK
eukprot:gene6151-11543_t